MKKMVKCCLAVFFTLWMCGCNEIYKGDDGDADSLEEAEITPGKEYKAQQKYNLNVIYYIPAGLDTLSLWHKRLSGITLYIQDYYEKNLKMYGYDRQFGLVVNEANPNYIQITTVRGTVPFAKMEDPFKTITDDVMNYFSQHPEEVQSNHFLIYMPRPTTSVWFANGIRPSDSGLEIPDYGFTVAGCDMLDFNIRHIDSKRAREKYLSHLGSVMHELGHAFYLAHNKERSTSLYYSLMGAPGDQSTTYGYSKYAKLPDLYTFTEADVVCLNELAVFSGEDKMPVEKPEISIESLNVSYRNDTITAGLTVRMSEPPVGAIMYSDPWKTKNAAYQLDITQEENPNTWTEDDAESVWTPWSGHSGNLYFFEFQLPWEEVGQLNYSPVGQNIKGMAELRFRFLMQGGLTWPFPGISIKGNEEFRWKYTVTRISIPGQPYTFLPDIPSGETDH